MTASTLKLELILGMVLVAFGMLALPVAVYWVGQVVIGGYESDAGMAGLIGAVWDDLGRGSIAAWILVLSPYVVIQLFRVAFGLLRRS
jgi:hypothetical protein